MILPQPATDPAFASGWDHPPEVSSPAGRRRCHWKTSQRLFCLDCREASRNDDDDDDDERANANANDAGSVVCAPIVLRHRFVLVASGMNLVVFGTFDSGGDNNDNDNDDNDDNDDDDDDSDSFDEAIQRRIDTKAKAPLTEFPICPDAERLSPDWNDKIIQLSFHEETGILYALSTESCVFQVRLAFGERVGGGGDPENRNDAKAPRRPLEFTFTLLRHWVASELGATCMATLGGDGAGRTEDAVCVGYRSGRVEGWSVPRTRSPSRAKQKRRAVDVNANANGVSLRWEGYLRDPIRTLSFLGREETTTDDDDDDDDDRESSGTASPANERFLVAIVATGARNAETRNRPPTCSAMKVLDLERMLRNEARARAGSSPTGDAPEASLEDWAVPGGEVMDAADVLSSSSSSSKTKKDSRPTTKRVPVVLESRGADAACILDTGCVAMAFPDGSVAFLSSGTAADESSSSSSSPSPRAPRWVASRDRQVLLSYPAIGTGQLIAADADGNSTAYLAACLRGGTCYLIPAAARGSDRRSIAAIPFPNDAESDVSDVYVQSFAAGNLFVDGDLLPVLVYAWPGGIVDVYGCGLVAAPSSKRGGNGGDRESEDSGNAADAAPSVTRAEKRALRDLIDNDSLATLASVADERRADSEHPSLRTEEWREFLAEAGNDARSSVGGLTLDALCSARHRNLRRLLLGTALATD